MKIFILIIITIKYQKFIILINSNLLWRINENKFRRFNDFEMIIDYISTFIILYKIYLLII